MKYLVAYPDALQLFDTREAAREHADEFRETKHLKIYEVREVEHLFPSGPKGPPEETPPPAGALEIAA